MVRVIREMTCASRIPCSWVNPAIPHIYLFTQGTGTPPGTSLTNQRGVTAACISRRRSPADLALMDECVGGTGTGCGAVYDLLIIVTRLPCRASKRNLPPRG